MKTAVKKTLSLFLGALMILSVLSACSSDKASGSDSDDQKQPNTTNTGNSENKDTDKDEHPSTVTVEHAYGTTEVPYCPERVCILDSACLDLMVALDLTDYVTCVKSAKKYPSYLLDYYTSDTIISLENSNGRGGHKGQNQDQSQEQGEHQGQGQNQGENQGQTENRGQSESQDRGQGGNTTENEDPYEMYYTIDADLIIAYVDTMDEDLYDILSQIAPTVVTGYNIDNEDGVYAGALENARMVASIWGVEDRVDTICEKYDVIYEELGEALNGVSGVVMFSAVASENANTLMVTPNNSWEDDSGKVECEQSVRIVYDLGMDLYSNDIPEEIANASAGGQEDDTNARAAKNKVIGDWVEEVNPDYLILVERDYASLEEAAADGNPLTALEDLTVVKNGNLCMLSIDGRDGSTGLYGLLIQLDELSAFFLD